MTRPGYSGPGFARMWETDAGRTADGKKMSASADIRQKLQ